MNSRRLLSCASSRLRTTGFGRGVRVAKRNLDGGAGIGDDCVSECCCCCCWLLGRPLGSRGEKGPADGGGE